MLAAALATAPGAHGQQPTPDPACAGPADQEPVNGGHAITLPAAPLQPASVLTLSLDALARAPRSPVPPSKLVSRPQADVALVNLQVGAQALVVLVRQAPQGRVDALAAFTVDRSTPVTRIGLHTLGGSDRTPDLQVLRAELLYTLAFRMGAEARYCWSATGRGCASDMDHDTLATLLQAIAVQRQCAIASLPAAAQAVQAPFRPWRSVSLAVTARKDVGMPVVRARLFDQGRPVAGATLFFSQMPHAVCQDTTQADGRAGCALVDTHGHDGGHQESEHGPITATYPGVLTPTLVLLPTSAAYWPAQGAAGNVDVGGP